MIKDHLTHNTARGISNSLFLHWQQKHGLPTLDEKVLETSRAVSVIALDRQLRDGLTPDEYQEFKQTITLDLEPAEVTRRYQARLRALKALEEGDVLGMLEEDEPDESGDEYSTPDGVFRL